MNRNRVNQSPNADDGFSLAKPSQLKEKVMSYEEKSVGSTSFYKCEACPYMALAEDDIKFHLFTEHPALAKTNGLADNIQILCPGCTSIFDAEDTLRTHLRNHHKMGFKDVKKMVKSLVQIALKNAKLKKEDREGIDTAPPPSKRQDIADVKMQVIEIVPDVVNAKTVLPNGVSFISVDELNKMSTPNFEKEDPKKIIKEASINIVYTSNVSTQYVNVSNTGMANTPCNIIQVSSVTPDLISSAQPRIGPAKAVKDSPKIAPFTQIIDSTSDITSQILKPEKISEDQSIKTDVRENELETSCTECHVTLKDLNKLSYHKKCHQNGRVVCPECGTDFRTVGTLHAHLWKRHSIDIEMPTCDICGFKTHSKYRLYNIHMKCHGKIKAHFCPICTESFKNSNQLSKHKLIHKIDENPAKCHICQRAFSNLKKLKVHISGVHSRLKPFQCCHCDYSAARKIELRLHMRSHTGDKPYKCDQCTYRSADHNSLRRHKKMHSKENVYTCKYCSYTAIQSTVFTSHMISKHPNISSSDLHRCPYCPYKSVSKEKYVTHLTTHTDKEGIQLLAEITKSAKSKVSWTIPSETEKNTKKDELETNEQNEEANNEIPIEVYDCDSLTESLPQKYSKSYSNASNGNQEADFNNLNVEPLIVTDLSKDDNNSDCLISESSNDTMMERHRYTPQLTYDNPQSNLHGFLNTTVSMEQSLLQNNNVNSLASNHSPIASSMSNNIMSNFPIRLPLVPQISMNNNITLKPVDKIQMPMTKFTGPILLPVPSSSNSPVNMSEEGAPRKKPKISVKSNLILKGPDQVNMFHSQQKMAFRRLEDNERFGLGGPVTFNNLITNQFMQLQPEPELSESPNNIIPYPQEPLMAGSVTTPVSNEMNDNPQIFTFNQQMNINSMTMLPPPQKIQTNDPSFIKLESTIKQNTLSPSLERMCNANLLSNPAINREYKASPPLEDIHKNMNDIKNEVKFYNMAMSNTATNPSIIDQYLMDNIIGEQYSVHTLDLSGGVLQEISDQQNDVIEIDDNSDDNKLPRFDINFPLESMYLLHNDFHFLENDIPTNEVAVNEMSRMVTEVPILNQKENVDVGPNEASNDFPNFIQGKKDPMMNTSVRPTINKINVKNIELMKN